MNKTLSIRVKELCSKRGITLKELAEQMDIKPESLSRALNGNPQLTTLENIAKALDVEVADLLAGGRSYEPSSSDFIAVIIDHGKSYVFHTKTELVKWLVD